MLTIHLDHLIALHESRQIASHVILWSVERLGYIASGRLALLPEKREHPEG